jgi:hypothetical protein
MKKLRLLGAVALVAAGATVLPVAAQDTFGLSEEDYTLFTSVNGMSAMAESYTFDLSAEASLGMLGGLSLTGSGVSSGGAFEFMVSGALNNGSEDMAAQLAVKVIDGSLYLSVDNGETWYGGTLEEVTGAASGMTGGAAGDLASGDMSGLMEMPGVGDAMMGLGDLNAADYISIVRAGDSFTTSIALGDLLGSDAIAPLIGGAMMGGSGDMASDPEMQAQMNAMVSSMFGEASVMIMQNVDSAAMMVQDTTLSIVLPLESMGIGNITLDLMIDLDNYGSAPAIAAPASFEPLADLMSGMGSMMGGM